MAPALHHTIFHENMALSNEAAAAVINIPASRKVDINGKIPH